MLKDSRETEFPIKSTNNSLECQAETLESLKGSSTKILDKILILFNKHGIVFANQTTLGKNASVGRRQANRLIKRLAEAGIIYKKYRSNLTSIYYPAPFLLDPKIRQRFSKKFEAFRWLPLILLFSGLFTENVSRTITANLFIKTISISNTITITNKSSQKRRRMGFYNDEAQEKQIFLLTEQLGLSKVGQIKLRPFPADCLAHAFDKLKYASNVKNSFYWILKLCNEWCKSEEIRPDWQIQFQLAKEQNIDLEGSTLSGETPRFKQQEQNSFKKSNGQKTGYQKRDGKRSSTNHIQTEEQKRYHDPEASLAYSKSLGEEIDARKLAQAIANKDEGAIRRYTKTPLAFTDPVFGPMAAQIAKALMQPEERQKTIKEYEGNPEMEIPLRVLKHVEKTAVAESTPMDMLVTVLSKSMGLEDKPTSQRTAKEWLEMTNEYAKIVSQDVPKSKQNPFMHVENARMDQQRLDEPPMIDYGMFEEIFETNEVVL